MNKAIVILLAAGLALLALGWHYDTTGRSADEKLGAILPTFLGFVLLIVDAVLLIVWLVRRRRQRTRDQAGARSV